jgi:glyoxylase-like metal-dependent hydrolase (beta-lactamase superfamily II)
MKTTRVNDELIQLTRLHFVNAFLVREDDGLTLVDTTMGGRAAEDLIGAAQQAGAAIRRIALTHGHGDHVGGLDALKQRLGDSVEVLMPELDARIHAGEKVVDGKLPGSWPKIHTVPDTRINAGDRVGSLEVIATPGHSPGHISFLDTRTRAVIAGDVYTSYGSVQVSNHFYLRFPLAQIATWDKGKDLESARTLRALEPAVLLVGHGPATSNPGAAMDRAIAQAPGSPAQAGGRVGR